MIFDDLVKLAVDNKFNGLEKPKQIMMIKDPWTVENDYLTPTMKIKRNVARDKLIDHIKTLYEAPVMKPTKK